MVCTIVGSVAHIPLCFLFVLGLDMGVEGLAAASGVKDAILLLVVYLYARCSPQISQVLQPISCEAFRGWGLYLKVCIPSTAMLCAEWWAFEVLILMAGILGVIDLAAMALCLNVHALLFRVPLGFSEAAGALIGNSIGANNVPLAKRFATLIFIIALLVMPLLALLTITGRATIVHWFSNEQTLN